MERKQMPDFEYHMYVVDSNGCIEESHGVSVWSDKAKEFQRVVLVPVMASILKEAIKAGFTVYDFEDMIAECMGECSYEG
jgi:hypothetical protein